MASLSQSEKAVEILRYFNFLCGVKSQMRFFQLNLIEIATYYHSNRNGDQDCGQKVESFCDMEPF